ncbi:basic salivary proline-rich protein 1-like [Rhipicephalus sanguineus]|uniref:basic salivary proline-rich protein 1-like n=1 Tax=Rhipicephalus sanguineus TaxID=34632 RepID=UPI001893E561|nr:basic salivary proline-rich protein 1-like [Rhipicephalus sanguineus]
MASQRTPGIGAPQRPDVPPAGGLGFSVPPQGYGPANQGFPQGAPHPAQGFTHQGSYPVGHIPGGASPPHPPLGPPSGFAHYPPPGGAGFTRLPYGAQNEATPPHSAPFGLGTLSTGVGFQPQFSSSLQGGYEPQPPPLGLGSRQTQKAVYEQGRQSPQGRGGPQAPLSLNASHLPGPNESAIGIVPSGRIQPGSGRSSPLPMWQNANQSPGMGMPTRPMPPEGRAEDGGFRPMDATRGTFQPVYPQPERTRAPSSSADAGATARAPRPAGLSGLHSTSTYSERSGSPPGPYSQERNFMPQKPHRPYAPPTAFPSGQLSSPGQKNVKSGAGQGNFPDPFPTGSSSGPGFRTASAGSFPGFKADRPVPAGSSRIISEEKLIASFINPKGQKSQEHVRSKSRTPRRKAEGEELLRAIEAFDALLAPDYEVGTAKTRHK